MKRKFNHKEHGLLERMILDLPGMKRTDDSNVLIEDVFEETGRRTTYFKFMSDKGVTDDHNGWVFRTFLVDNGVTLVNTAVPAIRKVVVFNSDIQRLFFDQPSPTDNVVIGMQIPWQGVVEFSKQYHAAVGHWPTPITLQNHFHGLLKDTLAQLATGAPQPQ